MKFLVVISVCLLGFVANGQKPTNPTPGPNQATLVRFYPNPAVNFITFEIKEPVQRGTNIQVFSFLGRQVATIPVNGQRITVSLNDYFKGIYVFQVKDPKGKVLETNKFQVNR